MKITFDKHYITTGMNYAQKVNEYTSKRPQVISNKSPEGDYESKSWIRTEVMLF